MGSSKFKPTALLTWSSCALAVLFAGCGAFVEIEQPSIDTGAGALNCIPEHHTRCVEGDVRWFDSCEEMGEVAVNCAVWAVCRDEGETHAECICAEAWEGIGCGECQADTDCLGPVGSCSPAGTCTCSATDSDPAAECTANTDCPDETYICARDWVSTGEDTDAQPQHFACLRKCYEDGLAGDGLTCTERQAISGVFSLVWVPPTTCFAYAQHVMGTTCTDRAPCAVIGATHEDALCPVDSCTYRCQSDDECLDDEICPTAVGYCVSQ